MRMRKLSQKIVTMFLAVVMILAMTVGAFAATINITGGNVQNGETYTAYKVFDVSTATSDGSITGYNYYTENEDLMSDLSAHGVTFSASPAGDLWYVTNVDATTLSSYLAGLNDGNLIDLLGVAAGSVTISDENNSIKDLDAGYYFVTSTMGSLCMLNTTADSVDIEEKNQVPVPEKTVSDTDAQIGDTVTYTVTITVPANTETLKLNDTLSNGLTLDTESFTVQVDDGEADEFDTVSTTTGDDASTSFIIDLTDYLTGTACTIKVTYEATINENAIHSNPATNSATVSYGSNSTSMATTTETNTHTLTIIKTDKDGNRLNGAEFQLADADGNLVYVVPVNDDAGDFAYYRVATSSSESGATTTIVVNGSVTIDGLDAETYTLTETKAPEGYNLLTESETVTVTADNKASITVENVAGSLLPSTGGMGTTIIYIVGAVLVIGAGIVLVVRRRMSANQ